MMPGLEHRSAFWLTALARISALAGCMQSVYMLSLDVLLEAGVICLHDFVDDA